MLRKTKNQTINIIQILKNRLLSLYENKGWLTTLCIWSRAPQVTLEGWHMCHNGYNHQSWVSSSFSCTAYSCWILFKATALSTRRTQSVKLLMSIAFFCYEQLFMVILECWSQVNDRLEKQLEKHTCSSSINKLMRVLKAHWLLPELRAKNCCSTFSFSSTLDQRKSIRANCVCWAGSEAVIICNVFRIFCPIYFAHSSFTCSGDLLDNRWLFVLISWAFYIF